MTRCPRTGWTVTPMGPEEAHQIIAWRYPPPYDFYNMANTEDVLALLAELLDGSYYALKSNIDRLAAFACIGNSARVPGGPYPMVGLTIDLGLGLRPELTGQGLGRRFMGDLLDWVAVEHPTARFVRLTVAEFNSRAVHLYEEAGFRTVGRFSHGDTWFQVMERGIK